MSLLHRAILSLFIVPLALASCANVPATESGAGGSSGGGTSGVSAPSVGSGGSLDREDPLDRVIKPRPCGVESGAVAGPDTAVTSSACPGSPAGSGPTASPVTPTPGMAGVHARGWDDVEVSADGLRLTITFVGGIEPCAALDHVDVAYGARAVTVTLYEGHDPGAEDVACIDIGVLDKVVVDLDEPVGDRAVTDGVA